MQLLTTLLPLPCRTQRGFSILELMVTLSVIAVVSTVGIPSLSDWLKALRTKGALETSYFILQQAKADAVRTRSEIYASFVSGSDWCIGLSQQQTCDCQVSAQCLVDGVERVWSSQAFSGVELSVIAFGKDDSTQFDGIRGLSSGHAGSVTFSTAPVEGKLILSNIGRARICVVRGQIGRYPQC